MGLFSCKETQPSSVADPTAIRTPLGVVRLGALLGDDALDSETPTATYRASGDGWVTVWERDDVDLELLVCRPHFASPLDMPVDACWGALWRGRAKASTIAPLIFSASWEDGYTWREVSPNSGQFLYAKTWWDESTDISIGTQDDELLVLRAQENDYLPSEWESHFLPSRDTVGYRETNGFWRHPLHIQLLTTGVACPLPALEEGQAFQIPFVVAWAQKSDTSSTATSIAVEASPAQILAGGGCV